MAVGEDEPVAVGPVGVGRVVLHHPAVEHVAERGERHRRALVAALGVQRGVHGEARGSSRSPGRRVRVRGSRARTATLPSRADRRPWATGVTCSARARRGPDRGRHRRQPGDRGRDRRRCWPSGAGTSSSRTATARTRRRRSSPPAPPTAVGPSPSPPTWPGPTRSRRCGPRSTGERARSTPSSTTPGSCRHRGGSRITTPTACGGSSTSTSSAPFLVAAGAVRRLSTAHGGAGGVIVNVSSRAAQLGSANEYVDYAASKAALDTFTVGLANEVARDGIRVVAVRPGLIETEIHEPGRLDRLGSTPPLGRPGTAREVAAAIAWLLSDEASLRHRRPARRRRWTLSPAARRRRAASGRGQQRERAPPATGRGRCGSGRRPGRSRGTPARPARAGT